MHSPVPYHEGTGEPLVLLHGFTDTWRGWTPVLAALSARHEVFAWTLPGHFGGEPWDRSVCLTPGAFADAVERQLDALGLGQVHLAGNSLGGWLSLELAARGRARSVVGVCPAFGWEPNSAQERSVVRFFRRSQVLLNRFDRLLPTVARHRALRRIALREGIANGSTVSAADAMAMFEGIQGCTIVSEALAMIGQTETMSLGPISCPVRILYGSKDRILRWPQHYRRMRTWLPDADWVELRGLGHVPMWDAPDLVAGAIVEHTSKCLGSDGAP